MKPAVLSFIAAFCWWGVFAFDGPAGKAAAVGAGVWTAAAALAWLSAGEGRE